MLEIFNAKTQTEGTQSRKGRSAAHVMIGSPRRRAGRRCRHPGSYLPGTAVAKTSWAGKLLDSHKGAMGIRQKNAPSYIMVKLAIE